MTALESMLTERGDAPRSYSFHVDGVLDDIGRGARRRVWSKAARELV